MLSLRQKPGIGEPIPTQVYTATTRAPLRNGAVKQSNMQPRVGSITSALSLQPLRMTRPVGDPTPQKTRSRCYISCQGVGQGHRLPFGRCNSL